LDGEGGSFEWTLDNLIKEVAEEMRKEKNSGMKSDYI
jgi:hypothetical protein